MTFTYAGTIAANHDSTHAIVTPWQEQLPQKQVEIAGTGNYRQIGTTLEEAFRLSAKGKW